MDNTANGEVDQKLDIAIDLLQHLVALELWKAGLTQEDIAKHLHVAKNTVVGLLRGVKKPK